MRRRLFSEEREGLRLSKKERLERGLLFVGEVAKLAGVLPSHIAFYTRGGFLKVHSVTRGKFNLYEKEETLKKLSLIAELQNKGLTLEKIKKKFKKLFET